VDRLETDNIGRDKKKLQEYNEYTSDSYYGSKPDKFLPSSAWVGLQSTQHWMLTMENF